MEIVIGGREIVVLAGKSNTIEISVPIFGSQCD